MNKRISLILLGLVLITSGCMSQNQSPETSTFSSEQEFIDYMEGSEDVQQNYAEAENSATSSGEVQRNQDSSQTMVDDFNWIKAGENNIYVSHRYPRLFQSINVPELSLEHNISDAGGPTVVSNDTVIVEESYIDETNRIVGYNQDLTEKWSLGLNSSVQEMKLVGDNVVLLTRENDIRCPIRPLHSVEIACTSILRPPYMGQSDYVYSLTIIGAETGEKLNSTGFVASSYAEVEVDEETTYISYSDRTHESEILTDFLLNEASIGEDMSDRVSELQGYDISDRSMQIELERAMREHESENLKELEEEFKAYDRENMRDYEESTLLKIDNSDLSITEESFDGRVTQILPGEETVIKREFRGVNYENREAEILVKGSVVELEGLELGYSEIQRAGNKLVLNGQDRVMVIDENGETQSIKIQAWNVQTFQDKILVSERGENGSLKLYNSELEELDSLETDYSIYGFNLVEGNGSGYAFLNNYDRPRLLKVTDELETFPTAASGRLVYLDGLYSVGDKVQRLSGEGQVEDEIEIISRQVMPLPEPR